ncbi:MAG: UbiA family prenyltransferase [Saprospiraceae bacterium]|nr:UbiA family prenyltransferase [Saprospiraceae bacterium]
MATFKLIRISNVLLIACIATLQDWILIRSVLPMENGLQILSFAMVLLAICLTAAAGYAINNVVDAPFDIYKRRSKNPIPKTMTASAGQSIYWLMAGCSVIASLAHYLITASWNIVVLVFLTHGLLYLYSTRWQAKRALGNVVVAICTGLMILAVPLGHPGLWNSTGQAYEWLWQTQLVLACMAMAFTFCREMVKDMEDIEGDGKAGHKTWAIQNLEQAKKVVNWCSILATIGLVMWSLQHIEMIGTKARLLLGVFVVLSILVARRLSQSHTPVAFGLVSLWFKGLMVLGVTYMLIWNL